MTGQHLPNYAVQFTLYKDSPVNTCTTTEHIQAAPAVRQ